MKVYECPVCHNRGLKIDLDNGFKIQTSGLPLKELKCVANCFVCKRKIKYNIVKDE